MSVRRGLFLALLTIAFAGFVVLGIWQMKRLAWKEDLIARVDARVHAEPVALPDQKSWPQIQKESHEYLHVRVSGRFRPDAVSLVAAATEEGQGYWVMAPLQQTDGRWLYINQGFVPQAQREAAANGELTPAEAVTLTGLLRLNQPGGDVVRNNVPAENRWYSRDVLAMAARLDLSPAAPFFIDAARTEHVSGQALPIGGLTVIQFHNNHLMYAFTWFALAFGMVLAGWLVMRTPPQSR